VHPTQYKNQNEGGNRERERSVAHKKRRAQTSLGGSKKKSETKTPGQPRRTRRIWVGGWKRICLDHKTTGKKRLNRSLSQQRIGHPQQETGKVAITKGIRRLDHSSHGGESGKLKDVRGARGKMRGGRQKGKGPLSEGWPVTKESRIDMQQQKVRSGGGRNLKSRAAGKVWPGKEN